MSEKTSAESLALSQMGATFAERKAAREGKKAVKKDDAEDKAVTSAATKSRKSAAKGKD